VQRPPTLNTSGIKRIAIMPFEYASSDGAYRELAEYATSVAANNTRTLNYFTMVDSSEIQRLRNSNQSIESHVDALLTGRITRVSSKDDTQQYQLTNKKTGVTTTYTYYTRDAEVEFSYSLMKARDGSVLGPVSKKGARSQRSEDRGSLSSVTGLLRPVIDSQLQLLSHDLVPHTVIENRALAKDSSKDKTLQAEMKEAQTQVVAGSYKAALDRYLGIYERYNSFAAAENASIIYEALGETQVAADLMQKAFNETGNPRARDILARLNRIMQDQSIIASDYGDSKGQVEKIAAFASGEIQKVLSNNAKVWIYNNSYTTSMAVAVVDDITSDFIKKGIGLVDRQNAALIEAEQRFQMSGAVNDNDFVSIGNIAGANTIVTMGITGTGAMRRLQVRVLDVEKGVPLMQSDTGENWQI
jgi:tetratricopeptide (TPR) repeat protein